MVTGRPMAIYDIVKVGTKTMEHNPKLEELFQKHFQPELPVNTITVNVKIDTSDIFLDVASVYSQEAERVMRFTSNAHFEISTEEFLKYFKTLLFLRVARVNNVTNSAVNGYKNIQRNLLIPAFVHILINSIGRATDTDYGFTFVPQVDINSVDLMSPEQMQDVSRRLVTLNREGLVCTETGVSMNPAGELSVMATLNIQGEILSYKKDHPVYGFYASFFRHSIVSNTISADILRIRYGAESDYRSYLHMIV